MSNESKCFIIDLLDDSDGDDDLLKDTKPIFVKRKRSPDSVTAVSYFPVTSPSDAAVAPASVDAKPAATAAAEYPFPTSVSSCYPAAEVAHPSTASMPMHREPFAPAAAAAVVEHLAFLGSFPSFICGAQHYRGQSHRGDAMTLKRDLDHAYDRNAIQVIGDDGAKRGLVPNLQAAALAPLLDPTTTALSYILTFKATILGVGDGYKIPMVVDVYAKSFHKLSIDEVKKISNAVDPTLQKVDWKSGTEPTTAEVLHAHEIQAELALDALHRAVSRGVATPQQALTMDDFVPADVDMSAMEGSEYEELDQMFDEIQAEQLANLPDIAMPKQFDSIELFDYQKDGIRWLYNQEKQDDAPPFFEKVGPKWLCTITGCKQGETPLPIRGSCLADDMGLGKTLQTLGLILLNPPEGQKEYPYVPRSLNAVSAPRCTLIVCPVSVMSNWVIQINKHVNGRVSNKVLKVSQYHGPKRDGLVSLVQFNQIDILITSYNTLAYDLKKWEEGMDPETKKKKQKVKAGNKMSIFDVAFHRVVLDEAHIIRSSTTGFYKSVTKLQTKYKCALTGTPFVNRPSDVHSLIAFLRLEPLSNKAAFDRAVTRRIKLRDPRGLATLRTTMAYVALRRTKAQVYSTIKLVTKTVENRILDFPDGGIHKETHDMLYLTARAAFLGFLRDRNEEGIVDNYMAFLELILRVRQACCHAGLVPAERRENAANALALVNKHTGELPMDLAETLLEVLRGTFQKEQLEECAVCRNELEEESTMVLRECKHIFCQACLNNIHNQVCPMCRVPYGPDDMISKQTAQAAVSAGKPAVKSATKDVKNAAKLGRSPKIQALLDLIDDMASDEKAVIFSQWTSYLNIIEDELRKEGHTYTRVDGTMSAELRGRAMEDFDTEGCETMKTPRFILCSLMACGTGVNLVRGNVVFMMDCWWNEAVELQAQDRVHRIGQKRPCRIYRLLMRDSIETRMLALQESKSALGKGSLQKLTPEESRKARITTLHDLFNVTNVEELWEES